MANNKKPAPKGKKTLCPISREDFTGKAKPLSIRIGDQLVSADVKEFSTGSFGWFLNGKVTVEVDGVPLKVQVGLNLTVVGSKETAKSEAA